MTTPESHPTSSIDKISSASADINILNPQQFKNFLDSTSDYRNVFETEMSENLPSPLESAYLECGPHRGNLSFHAGMDFSTEAIDHEPHLWQEVVQTGIKERLIESDYTLYSLPHQAYGFYASLCEEYVAHIQLGSETHTCNITIKTVRKHELENQLQDIITNPENEEDTDAYFVFKQFSQVWAHAIDTVASSYGNSGAHVAQPTITLAPPIDQYESHTRTEPLALESLAPVSIPEVEQVSSTEHSLNMLGGLEYPKERMRAIADTFNDPVGSRLYGLEAHHFMLYGPAGTGKTSLVHALAGEIPGATVQQVASDDIIEALVGSSGTNLSNIFKTAFKSTEPLILFFDEFDAIAAKTKNTTISHTEVKKLLNQFILEASAKHPNVIIGAATNLDPNDIEESLIRSGRLEPIGVPLPNEEERIDIWSAVLARSIHTFEQEVLLTPEQIDADEDAFLPYAEDINPIELAARTEDMTGADFEQILSKARRICYGRYRQTGVHHKVTQNDLLAVISQFYKR